MTRVTRTGRTGRQSRTLDLRLRAIRDSRVLDLKGRAERARDTGRLTILRSGRGEAALRTARLIDSGREFRLRTSKAAREFITTGRERRMVSRAALAAGASASLFATPATAATASPLDFIFPVAEAASSGKFGLIAGVIGGAALVIGIAIYLSRREKSSDRMIRGRQLRRAEAFFHENRDIGSLQNKFSAKPWNTIREKLWRFAGSNSKKDSESLLDGLSRLTQLLTTERERNKYADDVDSMSDANWLRFTSAEVQRLCGTQAAAESATRAIFTGQSFQEVAAYTDHFGRPGIRDLYVLRHALEISQSEGPFNERETRLQTYGRFLSEVMTEDDYVVPYRLYETALILHRRYKSVERRTLDEVLPPISTDGFMGDYWRAYLRGTETDLLRRWWTEGTVFSNESLTRLQSAGLRNPFDIPVLNVDDFTFTVKGPHPIMISDGTIYPTRLRAEMQNRDGKVFMVRLRVQTDPDETTSRKPYLMTEMHPRDQDNDLDATFRNATVSWTQRFASHVGAQGVKTSCSGVQFDRTFFPATRKMEAFDAADAREIWRRMGEEGRGLVRTGQGQVSEAEVMRVIAKEGVAGLASCTEGGLRTALARPNEGERLDRETAEAILQMLEGFNTPEQLVALAASLGGKSAGQLLTFTIPLIKSTLGQRTNAVYLRWMKAMELLEHDNLLFNLANRLPEEARAGVETTDGQSRVDAEELLVSLTENVSIYVRDNIDFALKPIVDTRLINNFLGLFEAFQTPLEQQILWCSLWPETRSQIPNLLERLDANERERWSAFWATTPLP